MVASGCHSIVAYEEHHHDCYVIDVDVVLGWMVPATSAQRAHAEEAGSAAGARLTDDR